MMVTRRSDEDDLKQKNIYEHFSYMFETRLNLN